MSESQSRYSIVADLTETKLEIITAKSNLDSEAKLVKQKIEQLGLKFILGTSGYEDDEGRRILFFHLRLWKLYNEFRRYLL